MSYFLSLLALYKFLYFFLQISVISRLVRSGSVNGLRIQVITHDFNQDDKCLLDSLHQCDTYRENHNAVTDSISDDFLIQVQLLCLSNFERQSEYTAVLKSFFNSKCENNVLIVQCVIKESSVKQIVQAKV